MAKLAQHLSRQLWSPAQLLGGRGVAITLVGALLALQCGCTVYQTARRTLIQEPSEFSTRRDRGRSLKVYRQWAEEAWATEMGTCPEFGDIEDYALGFRDGFVDFVYAGGAGEPPPVPPRKFWNVGWRTPAGAAAADQWFAGYRHGAQSAREGGYRFGGIVQSTHAETPSPVTWDSAFPAVGAAEEEVAIPSEAPLDTAPLIEGEPMPQPQGEGESQNLEDNPVEEGSGSEESLEELPQLQSDEGGTGPPAPAMPPATGASSEGTVPTRIQSASLIFRRALNATNHSQSTVNTP